MTTRVHRSAFAITGNLLIGFAGINSATTMQDAQTAVNAVVAAAK